MTGIEPETVRALARDLAGDAARSGLRAASAHAWDRTAH